MAVHKTAECKTWPWGESLLIVLLINMICSNQIIFDSTLNSFIALLDRRWNSTWNYEEIIRNIFYHDKSMIMMKLPLKYLNSSGSRSICTTTTRQFPTGSEHRQHIDETRRSRSTDIYEEQPIARCNNDFKKSTDPRPGPRNAWICIWLRRELWFALLDHKFSSMCGAQEEMWGFKEEITLQFPYSSEALLMFIILSSFD